MLKDITRARMLKVWFTAVALVLVAAIAFGASITMSTGFLLGGLCLVPPVMLFMLWPAPVTQTAGDVLRGTERRD